jgi:hypothetical protein
MTVSKKTKLLVIAFAVSFLTLRISLGIGVDLCRDAYVDICDLQMLADNWLTSSAVADVNNDQHVDMKDYSQLSGKWHKTTALPEVISETAEQLEVTAADINTLWQSSPGVTLTAEGAAGEILSAAYDPAGGQVNMDYSLAADHIIGERLDLLLQGDGSGNILKIYCYHTTSSAWLKLAEITLDFADTRHLVIPAQNPIHRFYHTVNSFRFEISGSDSGIIKLSDMKLAAPVLVGAPLDAKVIPSPMFDFWGSPTRSAIETAAPLIDYSMQIAPISFFNVEQVSDRTSYAKSVVKSIDEGGKIAAIQFYNHPGSWVSEHPEFLVKNQDGQLQTDGGAFTSPWNPQARQLWHDHIVASLNDLQANNRLQYVRAVEICPGLESEMCYEWSNVWAFDDYAIAAYRDYLKTFYENDISALNADWLSSYGDFDSIMPPSQWYPDREHWIFTDFYRYSMLEYYVFLAEAVKEVFEPDYWIAMPHTLPSYPMRFYSARYPVFYGESLRRLGLLDYAQIAALDWQHKEDVEYMQSMGLKVIGEIDVQPSLYSLDNVARQSKKYGMDGFYMGILEPMIEGVGLTPLGELAAELINEYSQPYSGFTFLEDFSDVSDWSVGGGSAAGGGSISVDSENTQQGVSGKLEYAVTSATGFDYVDFYKTFSPLDLQGKKLVFYLKLPDMPEALLQLTLVSANGGFLEYDFDTEDGLWRRYKLDTGRDFADYGTSPDLSEINLIRFRVNGDVSSLAGSGSINLDAFGFTD